jgi:hypothetical protein
MYRFLPIVCTGSDGRAQPEPTNTVPTLTVVESAYLSVPQAPPVAPQPPKSPVVHESKNADAQDQTDEEKVRKTLGYPCH